MSVRPGLRRKAHFLGTKIKGLRKRNNLTLEDLSVRCIQIDAEAGPSVSYLSMIENGKRMPSAKLLGIVADIFQKDPDWFYDEALDDDAIDTAPAAAVGGMPLEPGFLFSESLLQLAIPELLAQTGTTGRQFAHLLIRAHQESNHNSFPDLERAAEGIGNKRFPLHTDDVLQLAATLGLKIQWFDNSAFKDRRETDKPLNTLVRSFFDAPGTVYLNRTLERNPARLKYDLANHIAHLVLHDGDGARAPQISGGRVSGRRHETDSLSVDAKDILYAWRDFECSYFAAALLAPKTPFRPVPRQAVLLHQRRRQDRTDACAGHAPHVQRLALQALALLRCLSAGQPARGVSRQRHPAAVGKHDDGVGPVPALGGIPHAQHAVVETVGADLGAAQRGRRAPVLLRVDSQSRCRGQLARSLRRRRSVARASGTKHRRARNHRNDRGQLQPERRVGRDTDGGEKAAREHRQNTEYRLDCRRRGPRTRPSSAREAVPVRATSIASAKRRRS